MFSQAQDCLGCTSNFLAVLPSIHGLDDAVLIMSPLLQGHMAVDEKHNGFLINKQTGGCLTPPPPGCYT